MDGAIFVHSWFYSWMVSFARVESLRGRMGAAQSARGVEGLFESLLVEAFA
jgi:hypothetical protein